MIHNNTNEPSFMHHSVKNALGLILVQEVAFEIQTRQKIFYDFLQPLWGQISQLQRAQPQYKQLHMVSLQFSWSSKWFLRC